MAALEAAARDQDEDSQPGNSAANNSGSETNAKGGKFEIKQEQDIKSEPDTNHMDTSDSNIGGGKSVNNDNCPSLKQEIKTEPMDTGDAGEDSEKSSKLDIVKFKEEPMSPSGAAAGSTINAIVKCEPKVFPEPIQSDAADSKKKCCKYQFVEQ